MFGNRDHQGDFTIFGYSLDSVGMKQRIWERLGITPQTIEIGTQGEFYFYTSDGDVAESEEALVLKLGFLRSKTKSALRARQLLEQKLAGPHSIDFDGFSGNGLVVGLSKTEPVFSVFQTLMAVPQLYYAVTQDGIICSDVLRCIVNALPHCELNEDILPQHFLFRSVYGSATYYRGIERLISGQYLRWDDGKMEVRLVRSLDVVKEEADYIQEDVRALKLLSEAMEAVVGDYVRQIDEMGQGYANLLSGGVDSTLVQYFINASSSQQRNRSISYAIQVPAFEFEVEYANQASQLLNTEHTYVKYAPQDYPGLLTRVVDILAQPPNLEIEPGFLAVVEYIHAADWPEKFFFSANAADAVFGNFDSWKLKGLEYLRKIPGSVPLLWGMGKALTPFSNRSHSFLLGAEIIANQNNPDAYCSPSNTVGVTVFGEKWDVLRRCFGDQVMRETLASRRNLASLYSSSEHYLDKVHFIDQSTFTYEVAVQEQQLFLAHHIQQVHPFNDEDLLKVALTFHPDMRYIKRFRPKHLLKRLLEQKSKAPVTRKRKGGSAVNDDLIAWMRSGPLRPMVEEINRPSFMEKNDFDQLILEPDYFLWSLLTLDIFKNHLIGH